jgi:hypothetical protein
MRYFGSMDAAQTQAEDTPENFEARLTRALEQAPQPAVPAEFATRVAAALPATRPRTRRVSVATTVAVLAAVVMLAGLLWLAPRSAPQFNNWAFDGELLLVTYLMALAFWFGLAKTRA